MSDRIRPMEGGGEGGLLLARWYADPLSPERAAALLREAERRRRAHPRCRACRLLALVAHAALGDPIEGAYRQLRTTLGRTTLGRTAHGRILAELLYGQLLLSRRLAAGLDRLRSAERAASRLCAPADYFRLGERHELLGWLVLGTEPRLPQPLAELLTEAAVIRRLSGGRRGRRSGAGAHRDTMD